MYLWLVLTHWNANCKRAEALHPQNLEWCRSHGRGSTDICGINECVKGSVTPPCHAWALSLKGVGVSVGYCCENKSLQNWVTSNNKHLLLLISLQFNGAVRWLGAGSIGLGVAHSSICGQLAGWQGGLALGGPHSEVGQLFGCQWGWRWTVQQFQLVCVMMVGLERKSRSAQRLLRLRLGSGTPYFHHSLLVKWVVKPAQIKRVGKLTPPLKRGNAEPPCKGVAIGKGEGLWAFSQSIHHIKDDSKAGHRSLSHSPFWTRA